jgi:hypothetical protein
MDSDSKIDSKEIGLEGLGSILLALWTRKWISWIINVLELPDWQSCCLLSKDSDRAGSQSSKAIEIYSKGTVFESWLGQLLSSPEDLRCFHRSLDSTSIQPQPLPFHILPNPPFMHHPTFRHSGFGSYNKNLVKSRTGRLSKVRELDYRSSLIMCEGTLVPLLS